MKRETVNAGLIRLGLIAAAALGLAGCGSGAQGSGGQGGGGVTGSYAIGGSVSGLSGSVVLQDNSGDNLTVKANGSFTFATPVSRGSHYKITVLTEPVGQTCSVSRDAGVAEGDVSDVTVSCIDNLYTIGGTVSGLSGTVVLQDNNADNLTVSANGNFVFATPVASGSAYAVTVLTQPAGQTCSVSAGAGMVSGHNVTNVTLVCSNQSFSVGGSVSGLLGTVTLKDNGGDSLTLSGNSAFTFATPVANGSPYTVTVSAPPVGQSCSVANGTGTIAGANVTNVVVTCSTYTYTIGGMVTGLIGSLVLQNNGGDNLTVSTNGPFTFATAVPYGSAYNVTLLSLQSVVKQTCTINFGSGTATANVNTVMVTCADDPL